MSIQTITRCGLRTGGGSIVAAGDAGNAEVAMPAGAVGLAVLMSRYKDARQAYDVVQTKIDKFYEIEESKPCKVEIGNLLKADGTKTPMFAHSAVEIVEAYRLRLQCAGDKADAIRAAMQNKVSDLMGQVDKREQTRKAAGLATLESDGERLWKLCEAAYEAVLATKPVSLEEARAKLACIGERYLQRLDTDFEPENVAAFAALI